MKTASVSSAKNSLSALLELVRQGETVIITDRNVPVAQLAPLPAGAGGDDGARLAALERAGLVRRGRGLSAKALLKRLPDFGEGEADVLGALIADRAEGR